MKCGKCNFRNTPGARFCAQCGTGLDLFETPSENVRSAIRDIERGSFLFGRYEVIEGIGSGGMGNVYRVFDRKIDEMIALKIVKPEIATDNDAIERFNQELKTARKIAHRNVCRMFDIGEETGTHYITMEYVTGEDLRSLINRIGQLTVAKTIDIARQVCEGLAEAHAMGVVHRDLKPQNIMIDDEGKAKIMDFGIARFIKAKGVTTTGTIIGTPEYMSPEQAEGRAADQRSDIYSLGILLYEALTGTVPFEGGTPLSVALKHKTETPANPRKLNSQIPADLANLVLKCLEKDRERRYQTVSEIISDLDRIERGIQARQRVGAGKKPLIHREMKINRKVLVPGGVILVLAVLMLAVWFLLLRPKPPGPIASKSEILMNEGEPGGAVVRNDKTQGVNAEEPPIGKDLPKSRKGTQNGGNDLEPGSSPRVPVGQDRMTIFSKADSIAVRQKPSVDQVKPDKRNEIEDRIENGVAAALRAYDKGNYQQALDQAKDVLKIDPKNIKAQNLMDLAWGKLAEAKIDSLIDQYAQSHAGNDPAAFYRMHCAPQLFERIRKDAEKDAERLSIMYENLRLLPSNRSIQLTGRDRAEAVFYQRLIGTRKGTGVEQELSNGMMRWTLEIEGDEWKIAEIVFNP